MRNREVDLRCRHRRNPSLDLSDACTARLRPLHQALQQGARRSLGDLSGRFLVLALALDRLKPDIAVLAQDLGGVVLRDRDFDCATDKRRGAARRRLRNDLARRGFGGQYQRHRCQQARSVQRGLGGFLIVADDIRHRGGRHRPRVAYGAEHPFDRDRRDDIQQERAAGQQIAGQRRRSGGRDRAGGLHSEGTTGQQIPADSCSACEGNRCCRREVERRNELQRAGDAERPRHRNRGGEREVERRDVGEIALNLRGARQRDRASGCQREAARRSVGKITRHLSSRSEQHSAALRDLPREADIPRCGQRAVKCERPGLCKRPREADVPGGAERPGERNGAGRRQGPGKA